MSNNKVFYFIVIYLPLFLVEREASMCPYYDEKIICVRYIKRHRQTTTLRPIARKMGNLVRSVRIIKNAKNRMVG